MMMYNNYLQFHHIAVGSDICNSGIFYLFQERILWIRIDKKRLIEIASTKNTKFFWVNNSYRNKIYIVKDEQIIAFSGFKNFQFSKIKFFLEKFYYSMLFPIYNFHFKSWPKTILSGENSFLLIEFFKKVAVKQINVLLREIKNGKFLQELESTKNKKTTTCYRELCGTYFTSIYIDYSIRNVSNFFLVHFFFDKPRQKKKLNIILFGDLVYKALNSKNFKLCFFRTQKTQIYVTRIKQNVSFFLLNFLPRIYYLDFIFFLSRAKKKNKCVFNTMSSMKNSKVLTTNFFGAIITIFHQRSLTLLYIDFQIQ